MGFAFVANSAIYATSSSSSSGDTSAAIGGSSHVLTSGNLVAVLIVVAGGPTPDVSAVTDSAGNTYTKDQKSGISTGGSVAEIWRSVTTTGGTGVTVKVTSKNSGTFLTFTAAEFSGNNSTQPDPNGSSGNTNTTNGSTSTTTGAISTTTANDLLVASIGDDTGATASFTEGSGFTSIASETSGASFECADFSYKILSGTVSSQTYTWTDTNNTDWSNAIQAYQPSVSAVVGGWEPVYPTGAEKWIPVAY